MGTRLEIAKLSTSLFVTLAIQSAFVKDMALRPSYEPATRELFWNNPANTLAYIALDALEDSAIVHICEFVATQFPNMTGGTPIRRAADLLAHRTAVSHPGRSRWDRQWMTEFHQQRRRHRDLRAAIVWDLQKHLNELTDEDRWGPQNGSLLVSPEMASTLEQIWQFSMNADAVRRIPPSSELLIQLRAAAPKFIEMLERYPSGRVPPNPSEVSETPDDGDDAT